MSIAFGWGAGKSLILLLRPRVATFFLSVRVLLSFLIQPQYPLYLFLISRVVVDPELAAGGEEEITDKSCKMRYAQVSQVAYFCWFVFLAKYSKHFFLQNCSSRPCDLIAEYWEYWEACNQLKHLLSKKRNCFQSSNEFSSSRVNYIIIRGLNGE